MKKFFSPEFAFSDIVMICLERGFYASVCSEQLAKSKQIFLSFFFSSLPLCASFILNQKLAFFAISVLSSLLDSSIKRIKLFCVSSGEKKSLKPLLLSMKQREQKSVR